MTIQHLMKDLQMSRYRLSKASGVPWDAVSDIYSGKTRLNSCDMETLFKLSKALGLSVEELKKLEAEPEISTADGKPDEKTYLETGLPASIQKAISDYLQGEQEQVLYLDCLWDELYGTINSNLWADIITKEQAIYLREKYLGLSCQQGLV